MSRSIGAVASIKGLSVLVRIQGARPAVGEILSVNGKPELRLYVEGQGNDFEVECLNVLGLNTIARGDEVLSDDVSLQLPVGKEIFGRVFNALGEPIDGGEVLQITETVPLSVKQPQLAVSREPAVLETGIKVIDFFAPFVKGCRIGIIGGAGVGKTVLTTEMMHNVAESKSAISFFVGIGERIREGHDLYHTLNERGLMGNTVMYMGQMNENAAMRSMVGPTAATVARHFCDQDNDVLFFVDNVYRFVQARNELATMKAGIPSEGGYQASLFSDLHRFEDSLFSSEKGTFTSVQSIYIPADDLSDPAVAEISQQLDSVIVLSRDVFERGIFPAVDLLATTSSLITPDVLGQRQCDLVGRVKAIMRKYSSLRTIIAIVGESELSPLDRQDYKRAEALVQYFSQNMFVTQDLSGKRGEFVSRESTLKGVEAILNT